MVGIADAIRDSLRIVSDPLERAGFSYQLSAYCWALFPFAALKSARVGD